MIPAAWCTAGRHRLEITIVCPDPGGRVTTGVVIEWSWIAKSPVRVRTVYMGLYPPAPQAMIQYARDALDLLPSPLNDVGVAARMWYWKSDYDLTDRDTILNFLLAA